jgi:DmsE family decaheme c-type cytochrome
MHPRAWPAVVSICLATVALLAPSALGQTPPPPSPEKPPWASAPPAEEPPVCVKCHKEAWEGFSLTKHAVRGDPRTPFGTGRDCQACHGDASEHLKNPVKNPIPQRFLRTQGPADAQSQVCLTCHQAGGRIHWQGSMHATQDVTCTTCHQLHTPHDRVRNKLDEPSVCFTCHKDQRAQINRPYRHPIREGLISCSDCHNPHGTVGPAMVKRDTIPDTCYVCHMEKRGPFVRNHPPVQENCAICHNPHGSTIAAMLRVRSPYLCQECHEPTSHRGTVPGDVFGSGTGTNRAVVLARGCVNCHTNIHGSNNPQSTTNERSFRR